MRKDLLALSLFFLGPGRPWGTKEILRTLMNVADQADPGMWLALEPKSVYRVLTELG